MPATLTWSEDADCLIRRLRAAGASWDSIAACLAVSRWSVIMRGRAIGAMAPPRHRAPPPPEPEREPLPPGHAASWGAITAGTSLAGTPYPWPPIGLTQ